MFVILHWLFRFVFHLLFCVPVSDYDNQIYPLYKYFFFFCRDYIQYFFKHTVTIQSSDGATLDLSYTFARVHWYKVHPHARFYFGLPIQVCLPSFEAGSVASFIPVSTIDSVCVVAELSYDLRTPNGKEKIAVVVPLNVKLHVWRFLVGDVSAFSSLNPKCFEANLGHTLILFDNFHKFSSAFTKLQMRQENSWYHTVN